MKISIYFLNLSLSFNFFEFKYSFSLPSFICRRVSFARNIRASFIFFYPYYSFSLNIPYVLMPSSVILCSLLSHKIQCNIFLVDTLEFLKTFHSFTPTISQSWHFFQDGVISMAFLRQTVRCFWKLWKEEGLNLLVQISKDQSSCTQKLQSFLSNSIGRGDYSSFIQSFSRNCSRYRFESPFFKQGILSGHSFSQSIALLAQDSAFSQKKICPNESLLIRSKIIIQIS